VDAAKLAVNDRIRIGNNQIKVDKPAPGYDLILSIEQVRGAQEKALEQAYMESSKQFMHKAGISLRGLSWGLSAFTLICFLVLPLLGFGVPAVGDFLRSYLSPVSDHAWDSGQLSQAHEYFGVNCNQCHVSAFATVRDDDCLACHKELKHHFDAARLEVAELKEGRCETCHKEHNGGQGLIRKDDGLCLDCHDDIKKIAAKSELQNVPGGFAEDHPNFKASLISYKEGKVEVRRVSMGEKTPIRESSTLFFPHKAHLNPKGIKGVEHDEILTCSSCHVPEPGGQKMQPIKFEQHCHSCHKLTFETADPKREVPHGDAKAVLETLKNYYADYAMDCENHLLDNPPPPEEAPRERPGSDANADNADAAEAPAAGCDASKASRGGRQRPGLGCDEEDSQPPIQPAPPMAPIPPLKYRCAMPMAEMAVLKDTKAWVAQKAESVRHNMLLAYRACGACHRIENDEVMPAKVSKVWFPKAHFDHAQHQAVECVKCHDKAEKSEDSRDVLVKDIESCRECHGEPGDHSKVGSACVTCHDFHVAEQLWKPKPPTPKVAASEDAGTANPKALVEPKARP
jgi:predicted CXXCH cytochrome family protein